MMINNYIYMLSNKWAHYKIKSLNKKISILKEEIDEFKVIENWISALALDLNDEISNYWYDFQLMNLKDIFLPKIIEDFIILKMKKDDFHTVISEKYVKKIKVLTIFINKKIEKENLSKRHLKKF